MTHLLANPCSPEDAFLLWGVLGSDLSPRAPSHVCVPNAWGCTCDELRPCKHDSMCVPIVRLIRLPSFYVLLRPGRPGLLRVFALHAGPPGAAFGMVVWVLCYRSRLALLRLFANASNLHAHASAPLPRAPHASFWAASDASYACAPFWGAGSGARVQLMVELCFGGAPAYTTYTQQQGYLLSQQDSTCG